MPSILITGANRGLGLEWARQYAETGWRVLATCRQPEAAHELQALARRFPELSLHRLDVTDAAQVRSLAGALRGVALDILLNNAGIYLEKYAEPVLGLLDYDGWARTCAVNTLGAVRVTEAFLDHVARSEWRLVVAIGSHMGSITDIAAPGSYYYRSSKAALNAAMKGLAQALRPRGIGVLILHPGWVRTRMGGPNAPLLPEESVLGMRASIERFTLADTGRFFRYDGTEIPW